MLRAPRRNSSFATAIRHRIRYSIGPTPNTSLKRVANPDRDTPHRRANSATLHSRAISPCKASSAPAMAGSSRAGDQSRRRVILPSASHAEASPPGSAPSIGRSETRCPGPGCSVSISFNFSNDRTRHDDVSSAATCSRDGNSSHSKLSFAVSKTKRPPRSVTGESVPSPSCSETLFAAATSSSLSSGSIVGSEVSTNGVAVRIRTKSSGRSNTGAS